MITEKMNAEFEIWRNEQIASLIRTGHVQAARAFRDLGSIHWIAWQSAWTLSCAAIDVELRDAYMKGWEMSGEGWNGEYPAMLHETERWQRERDEALGIKP